MTHHLAKDSIRVASSRHRCFHICLLLFLHKQTRSGEPPGRSSTTLLFLHKQTRSGEPPGRSSTTLLFLHKQTRCIDTMAQIRILKTKRRGCHHILPRNPTPALQILLPWRLLRITLQTQARRCRCSWLHLQRS
jgi:hypothetical protein